MRTGVGARQPIKPQGQTGKEGDRCQRLRIIFYPGGKHGATVSGEGSFDTANQFDAFNSDSAQLFEIDQGY